MKKLLILGLLLVSATSVQARLQQPICVEQDGVKKLFYEGGAGHFWQDFCNNGLGIMTPKECIKYQQTASQEQMEEDINKFLKAKLKKICGE